MSNPNIYIYSAKGAIARNIKLSPERRREIASLAAKKRWELYREKKCKEI